MKGVPSGHAGHMEATILPFTREEAAWALLPDYAVLIRPEVGRPRIYCEGLDFDMALAMVEEARKHGPAEVLEEAIARREARG